MVRRMVTRDYQLARVFRTEHYHYKEDYFNHSKKIRHVLGLRERAEIKNKVFKTRYHVNINTALIRLLIRY